MSFSVIILIIYSYMHELNEYLLCTSYVPGPVLGTWDTLVNRTGKEFAFMELTNGWGEKTIKNKHK